VCWEKKRSANPVGQIVLSLFGQWNPETAEFSDSICTALQLVNFWQDVAVDVLKGRIYLPQEDMRAFGVGDDDIAHKHFTSAFHDLMVYEVHRTLKLFLKGERLIPLLHGRLKIEISWVITSGKSVLKRIVANDFDVFEKNNSLKAIHHTLNLLSALQEWMTSVIWQ